MRVRTDTCSMLRSCFGGAHAAKSGNDEGKQINGCCCLRGSDRGGVGGGGGANAVASRHSTGLHLSERCTASVLHNVANVINVMETRGGVAGGMETEALRLFLFGVLALALLGSEPQSGGKSSFLGDRDARAPSKESFLKCCCRFRRPELAPA